MKASDARIVEQFRRRMKKLGGGSEGDPAQLATLEGQLGTTTGEAAGKLRAKSAKDARVALGGKFRATAEAVQAGNIRLAELRGSSGDAELLRLEEAYGAELQRFKDNAEAKLEVEAWYQRERQRLEHESTYAGIQNVVQTGDAVMGAVSSMMGAYQSLAQARVRSAQAQVKAGKMTEEQAKKEQRAAFKLQEQMIIADGVMHLFKGLGQQAHALERVPTPATFAKGIAHQAAAAAHFAQAAIAPQMAQHARTANAAGLSASGGGAGLGGAGAGGYRSDSGAASIESTKGGPAIQFGDIVLSDVPALLSREGLDHLGSQIAGSVTREINNQSDQAGGSRISRRAMRR